jgi:hypothetical protein
LSELPSVSGQGPPAPFEVLSDPSPSYGGSDRGKHILSREEFAQRFSGAIGSTAAGYFTAAAQLNQSAADSISAPVFSMDSDGHMRRQSSGVSELADLVEKNARMGERISAAARRFSGQ